MTAKSKTKLYDKTFGENEEAARPLINVSAGGRYARKNHTTVKAVESLTPTSPLLRRRRRQERPMKQADEATPVFLHSTWTWVIGEELDWIPPTPSGWEHFIVKPEFRSNWRFFPLKQFRTKESDEQLVDARLYVVGQWSSIARSASGAWRGDRMVLRSTDEDFPTILPELLDNSEANVKIEADHDDPIISVDCNDHGDVRLLLKFEKHYQKKTQRYVP